MTPILSVIRHGRSTLTCDQTCYDASNESCTCICGGLNHGAGRAAAHRHSQEQFIEILDRLQRQIPDLHYVILHCSITPRISIQAYPKED